MFRVVQPSSQCNFRAFVSPQQETLRPLEDTPLSQPHTHATTNLLSVPMNLPFLGMSCKWDNKMWVLLLRLFSLGIIYIYIYFFFRIIFLRLICVVAYISASFVKNTKPTELPWNFSWKSVDQPILGLWRLCIQLLLLFSLFKLCLTLCDHMEYSPPGLSVCGIYQARILEWVAISSPLIYISVLMPVSQFDYCCVISPKII